ncbi:MAG: fused MFS/spermidine synthase, partial [Chloroflexota bacterium]|nr:fused MFS/spermidine synthase [Chloroflexota bacterium]
MDSEQVSTPSVSRWAWVAPIATVFVSSLCIMVLELVAGRLIARHVGSSLYTWTSVIGIVLSGIAAGNYIGGRLADRFPPKETLSLIFLVASANCLLIPVLNNRIGGME